MKSFIVFAVALAVAHADVSHVLAKGPEATAEVVRSGFDVSPEGQFQYSFETSNGISSQAEGTLKNTNAENPTLEITGQSSWTAADGTPVHITYIANENGYQPSSDVLPVAPPIPEAILRGLKYIEDHPAPVERVSVNAAPQFARTG